MNAIERVLANEDSFKTEVEYFEWGGTLAVWRCSKLVSGHGVEGVRRRVMTGGIEFLGTFALDVCNLGKPEPIRSRLRPGWTVDSAQARYRHVVERMAEEACVLVPRREIVYRRLREAEEQLGLAPLLALAETNGLHLDVFDLTLEQLDQWMNLTEPLDNRSLTV